MSIQNKFLLPVMLVIIVAGIMVYLSLTNVVEKNFEENQHDWFETKVGEIDKIQSSMSKNALTHSAIYSKDPEVIENYTIAHNGNIDNPTDFSSSLARENLREYFAPIQDGINSNTNENYKIHFHLPNGRSLLRTWQKTQKKNGEDISDDISSFRNTVVQINSGNHKPIDGIEIGRSGFSIRGISPVTNNGEHLGSVEMIYDFNPVINSVDFTEHDDYAVLMNAEFSDIATSLNDRKKHPIVRDDYIFVTSTNDTKMMELLNSHSEESIESAEYMDFGKNLVLGSPIKDFSGEEIGLLLIVNDVSGQKAELASLKRNIIFGIIAALLFAGITLFINVQSVIKPLKEITNKLSRVALGDLSVSVDINRNDEIGDLADSFRGIIKAQKDKLFVADEIANGNLDVKIDKASDMDQLALSMNKMRDNIKRQQFESDNILKSIGAPMFITDENLVVKSINEAALGAVGYKSDEVVGKMTCGDMCRTPICGTENCTIKNAMKSGEVVVGETKAKTRDNNEIPISAVCSALFDENGKPYGGMEILFDQSVQKETLNEVGRLIDAAAKGMLSERARMGRSEGDYRKLLEGVNEMLDNIVEPLKESMDVLKFAADNDLSTRVNGNYKGDFDELKRNLNTAIDNLDSSLAQVENAASQVSSASGQIASTSQSLASSASQQASSLEEISSSLEQMSSMTLENASNANQAKNISSSANNLAKDGNSIMKGLLGSMEGIKTASDSTAKIIKSIDEIAFQTNLLALNAAVEAARAGEAGKGFAVVAEEVRNLAMRSADAAKTTSDLIQSLKDSADNGVNISGEAAEKFSQILTETEKVQTIVTEIDVATSEQKNGIEQLNNAVTQINQLTQSNAAVSEEAASSSEELSSQAQMLKELVAKFDLTDDSGIALRKSA